MSAVFDKAKNKPRVIVFVLRNHLALISAAVEELLSGASVPWNTNVKLLSQTLA